MSKCNDSWTSKDKALHVGVCFVLAIINPFIALLAAMGKELDDETILKAAYLFWFADEDRGEEGKIWRYFCK